MVTRTTAAPSRPHQAIAVSSTSPQVRLWALIGGASVVFILIGFARWLLSGPVSTPPGPDDFATWKLVCLRAFEVASPILAGYLIWRFLLKPLVRDRTLTLDGMIIIGGFLLWFYDPMVNYFNFAFAYNAHFVNLGSWTSFIPGWEAPNQARFVEPLVFIGGAYIWYILGASLFGCAILRWLKARYPAMSNLGLFSALFVLISVFDIFFEGFFIRTEMWAYPGLPRVGTLFAGTPYQFPIFGGMLIGLYSVGLTMIRWFRDDQGRSFVERGVDRLAIPPKAKKLVSLLAVTGFLHVWLWVGYYMPFQLMVMKADTMPALPSYLRQGICGEGTDYACPSGAVPIPSRGSLHLRPDDPQLPADVRARQLSPD